MRPAEPYLTIDVPCASPDAVRGGIVSRLALFEQLRGAARVTLVSAPAGSGKTHLLRSWIAESGLVDSAAWVPVQRGEQDPQRFWISVLDALRETIAGSKLVRPLTGAPDLDGWAVAERLVEDLEPLEDKLWLVIDDVHELRADALAQLESLQLACGRDGQAAAALAPVPHERGGLGGSPPRLAEPLSRSETRVLRFLPTNLSAPEIARQLSLSVNTVRTHMRHVYEKLGAHCRTEAVEQARTLGLLAAPPHRVSPSPSIGM